jgi:hypothetical protein
MPESSREKDGDREGEDEEESERDSEENEDDDEEYRMVEMEAYHAEAQQGWEPERSAATVTIIDPDAEATNPGEETFRLRGGAEETLDQRPRNVKFGGHAGEPFSDEGEGQFEMYAQKLGQTDNPFAPFSSQLEWEIARWGKMRGPSSTALTELLSIDRVSQQLDHVSRCFDSLASYQGC